MLVIFIGLLLCNNQYFIHMIYPTIIIYFLKYSNITYILKDTVEYITNIKITTYHLINI